MQAPRWEEPVLAPVLLLLGQEVQAVVPDWVEYVPARQAVHVSDEKAPRATEKVPGEQRRHVLLAGAPWAVE